MSADGFLQPRKTTKRMNKASSTMTSRFGAHEPSGN